MSTAVSTYQVPGTDYRAYAFRHSLLYYFVPGYQSNAVVRRSNPGGVGSYSTTQVRQNRTAATLIAYGFEVRTPHQRGSPLPRRLLVFVNYYCSFLSYQIDAGVDGIRYQVGAILHRTETNSPIALLLFCGFCGASIPSKAAGDTTGG